MTTQQIMVNGAVLAGLVFLAVSLVIHIRAENSIPGEILPKWRLLTGLIAFFLAGYLFFLFIQGRRLAFPLEILTAAVFCGGGFFVFMITGITLRSLRQIVAHEQQLSEMNEELQRSNRDLVKAYDSTIEGWGRALDLRDRETQGHTERVARLTREIAREFGVTEEELVNLTRGALLHDIGKMAVSDSVLLKSGPLSDSERELMKSHPLFAYEMLSKIDYLKSALDIPYCHHERWDGTGYPRGLKGNEIPLAARIFAVADTWDALINERRYHDAWSREMACAHIKSRAGSHFDPAVVEVFLKMDCCRGNSCSSDKPSALKTGT